jgi:hypothetical protein
MFKYLFDLWDGMNRSSDLTLLWPACKEHAPHLDHAKMAFFMHVQHDPAWTNHYTEEELIRYVDTLT